MFIRLIDKWRDGRGEEGVLSVCCPYFLFRFWNTLLVPKNKSGTFGCLHLSETCCNHPLWTLCAHLRRAFAIIPPKNDAITQKCYAAFRRHAANTPVETLWEFTWYDSSAATGTSLPFFLNEADHFLQDLWYAESGVETPAIKTHFSLFLFWAIKKKE